MRSHINFEKYKWIYFDLDGTLHDFVYASTKANEESIRLICEYLDIDYLEAFDIYKNIFRTSQGNHFVSSFSSNEHRLSRFSKLIEHYSFLEIPSDFQFLMLHTYNMNFARNLKPYKDVIKLFLNLRKREKKIAIVSEGPHDAQEFVIQQLGLTPLIDLLATSGKYNLSKSDGLFKKTLDLTNASSEEVLVIGDSPERDIYPAQKIGTDVILIDHHKRNAKLNDVQRIESLSELIDTK